VGGDTTVLFDTDGLNRVRTELVGTALRAQDVGAGLVHVQAGIKITNSTACLPGGDWPCRRWAEAVANRWPAP
jgi:hypothetical protein